MIELHSGRLSAFSDGEGLGCTFSVELPLQNWRNNDDVSLDAAPPVRAPSVRQLSRAKSPDSQVFKRDRESFMQAHVIDGASNKSAVASDRSSRSARVSQLSVDLGRFVAAGSSLSRGSSISGGGSILGGTVGNWDGNRSPPQGTVGSGIVATIDEALEAARRLALLDGSLSASNVVGSSLTDSQGVPGVMIGVSADIRAPLTTLSTSSQPQPPSRRSSASNVTGTATSEPKTRSSSVTSPSSKSTVAATDGAHRKWLSGITICVVDDSIASRKSVRRLLARQGHSVTEASDGTEIVKLMSAPTATFPDLILMDNLMPEMDGPIATMKLREQGYKGLIVGLTGNIFETEVRLFEAAGANHVLAKPLNMVELQKIVSLWLTIEGNISSVAVDACVYVYVYACIILFDTFFSIDAVSGNILSGQESGGGAVSVAVMQTGGVPQSTRSPEGGNSFSSASGAERASLRSSFSLLSLEAVSRAVESSAQHIPLLSSMLRQHKQLGDLIEETSEHSGASFARPMGTSTNLTNLTMSGKWAGGLQFVIVATTKESRQMLGSAVSSIGHNVSEYLDLPQLVRAIRSAGIQAQQAAAQSMLLGSQFSAVSGYSYQRGLPMNFLDGSGLSSLQSHTLRQSGGAGGANAEPAVASFCDVVLLDIDIDFESSIKNKERDKAQSMAAEILSRTTFRGLLIGVRVDQRPGLPSDGRCAMTAEDVDRFDAVLSKPIDGDFLRTLVVDKLKEIGR